MVSVLPKLGVSIAPSDNGTVTVQLPAEVAELFLMDLDQRAGEWAEAMRKARIQESERNAERIAASGEGRRKWEAQEDAWAAQYEALRAKGKGHREALHLIRGPKEPEAVLITDVEAGIKKSQARRRRQQRKARDEEIMRLASEGLSRWEISDRLRVAYPTVVLVMRKNSIPVRDARHDRKGEIGAVG